MAAEKTYFSENYSQQVGLGKKVSNPVGKTVGKSEGRILQKVFQQDKNDAKSVRPRTFGDISNRLGAHLKSTRKDELKFPKSFVPIMTSSTQVSGISAQISKTTSKFPSPFSGPEFRPDIKEFEDFDDILPPNLQLSEGTIKKFVQCWNKKFYGGGSQSEIPSSSHDFDPLIIDPIMDDQCVNEVLEPVLDDFLFDIPPNSYLDM